jgi:hypothetical protein
MIPIVAAFSLLSLIIVAACHVSRTNIRSTISSGVHNPPSHDKSLTEARASTTSFDPKQRAEGWNKLAQWTEKCTQTFLPKQDIDFATFIQSVTLCAILAGIYDVDPESSSPLDITVAFMTNALNYHSDCATGQGRLNVGEPYTRERINRWVREGAWETILPAYESMWHLAAVTLAYANNDQHMRNAFLDFSENPTEKQFRAFKVKDTKPSVEAIIKEVARLYPPMRKSRHPWWRQLFGQMAGNQPESFDAMRLHPKRRSHSVLSFAYDGLNCTEEEEWVHMTTALIVAKVIDRVDDVRFVLTGNEFDTIAGRDTRTWWNGWVIKKKEKAHTSFPPTSAPPPPYTNLIES